MPESKPPTAWSSCESTVIGTSHARHGKPNQDSVCVGRAACGAVIAAVADGHGSRKCFRSHLGSWFAAEIVVDHLTRTLERHRSGERVNWEADARLVCRDTVQAWREKVDEDYAKSQFSDDDRDGLTEGEKRELKDCPRMAYGTTLVACLLTADFGVYLQLGDGDILVVPGVRAEPRRPLEPDERSFANSTASLAMRRTPNPLVPASDEGPWGDFRIAYESFGGGAPAMVMLTTDGYPNAFADDAGFRKAATDILGLWRSEGPGFVGAGLRGWLEAATTHGSGDDVTVVLAFSGSGPEPPVLPECDGTPAESRLESALPGDDGSEIAAKEGRD